MNFTPAFVYFQKPNNSCGRGRRTMNNIRPLKTNRPYILEQINHLKTLKLYFIKYFSPRSCLAKSSEPRLLGKLLFQNFRSNSRQNFCGTVLGTLLIATWSAGASESVRLFWNPSADTNVVSYLVYYGTSSRNYSGSINAGKATSAQIYCVNGGATYYFAVASVDAQGDQSALSAEVSYAVPLPVPSLLQTQVKYDQNGQPYSMSITATSNDPGVWELDCSTNLQTWSSYCSGSGDYVFASVFLTDTTKPKMFFRLQYH